MRHKGIYTGRILASAQHVITFYYILFPCGIIHVLINKQILTSASYVVTFLGMCGSGYDTDLMVHFESPQITASCMIFHVFYSLIFEPYTG